MNEIVVAANWPWWLTCTAVFPLPIRATVDSGTIVSLVVLMAAPLEASDLPLLEMPFVAALRAELSTELEAVDELTVPLTALLLAVPLALCPEVLT